MELLKNIYIDNADNINLELKRWKDQQFTLINDQVSQEVPIFLSYGEMQNGTWHKLGERELWAWPSLLNELALGNALLEGREGASDSFLVESEAVPSFKSSSGLVFHSAFKATVAKLKKPEGKNLSLSPEELVSAMRSFMGAAGLWDDTGCFHRAGIFDVASKSVLKVAEDIGRHNCIDRLTGFAALNDIALGDHVLVVSARMSASLCKKALQAGFRFLISRSAVTTASINMVKESNGTLVGFARDKEGRFTIFNDAKGWIK